MSNGRFDQDGGATLGPSRSGRRFVVGAVLVILVLWGAIFLAFREWRARHRALAEFGRREVAALVEPLANRVPTGVPPKEWRSAVDDTRRMLEIAVSSGTMDRPRIERLRDDLSARFAKAPPETIAAELGMVWDEMRKEVGPVLSSQSRPPFCPPKPVILKKATDPRAPSR